MSSTEKQKELDYKKLYEEEKQKRKLLEAVFDTNPSMMWLKDDNNIMLKVNETAARALGLTPQEMEGKPTAEFYGEELSNKYLADDRAVLSSGKSTIGMVEKVVVQDGTHRWVRTDKIPYQSDNTGQKVLIVSARDVSNQIQIKEDLAQVNERLEFALRGSKVGIWDWFDVQRSEEWWSPEFYEILGYEDKEIEASLENFGSFLHPDDKERAFEAVRLDFEEDVPFDIEYRLQTKSGDYKWIHARAKVFRDRHGKPHRMAGTIVDIHDRRALEEKLLKNEERLALALDSSSVGTWDWDITHNILVWDDWMFKLYGLESEDFEGAYAAYESAVHPDDRESVNADIQMAVEGKKEYNRMFRIVHPDGQVRFIDARSKTFQDQSGKIVRMIGTNWDVTEKVLAEKRMQLIIDDLERFAYVASHDLQEPIRKILSFISILESSLAGKLDAEEQQNFQYVKDAAFRMRTLIRDLLQYSKAGKLDIRKDYFDLNYVVNETLETLGLVIQEKNAEITVEGLPSLRCSRTAMGLVFQNLISNAMKFSKPGISPQVSVSAQPKNGKWEFCVQDNGIGFESKYEKKIFEVFQRLHGRGEYEGNGIGLSICKRLVEAHGGEIWVKSTIDQGTAFYFTLPENTPPSIL